MLGRSVHKNEVTPPLLSLLTFARSRAGRLAVGGRGEIWRVTTRARAKPAVVALSIKIVALHRMVDVVLPTVIKPQASLGVACRAVSRRIQRLHETATSETATSETGIETDVVVHVLTRVMGPGNDGIVAGIAAHLVYPVVQRCDSGNARICCLCIEQEQGGTT